VWREEMMMRKRWRIECNLLSMAERGEEVVVMEDRIFVVMARFASPAG
jgi:hypothetical protein